MRGGGGEQAAIEQRRAGSALICRDVPRACRLPHSVGPRPPSPPCASNTTLRIGCILVGGSQNCPPRPLTPLYRLHCGR